MIDGRGSQTLAHLINACYRTREERSNGGKRRAVRKGPDLNVEMREASRDTPTLATYAARRAIPAGQELRVDYGDQYWRQYGEGSALWGQDVPGAGDWVQGGRVHRERESAGPSGPEPNIPPSDAGGDGREQSSEHGDCPDSPTRPPPPPSLPPSPPAPGDWEYDLEDDLEDLIAQDQSDHAAEQSPPPEPEAEPDPSTDAGPLREQVEWSLEEELLGEAEQPEGDGGRSDDDGTQGAEAQELDSNRDREGAKRKRDDHEHTHARISMTRAAPGAKRRLLTGVRWDPSPLEHMKRRLGDNGWRRDACIRERIT